MVCAHRRLFSRSARAGLRGRVRMRGDPGTGGGAYAAVRQSDAGVCRRGVSRQVDPAARDGAGGDDESRRPRPDVAAGRPYRPADGAVRQHGRPSDHGRGVARLRNLGRGGGGRAIYQHRLHVDGQGEGLGRWRDLRRGHTDGRGRAGAQGNSGGVHADLRSSRKRTGRRCGVVLCRGRGGGARAIAAADFSHARGGEGAVGRGRAIYEPDRDQGCEPARQRRRGQHRRDGRPDYGGRTAGVCFDVAGYLDQGRWRVEAQAIRRAVVPRGGSQVRSGSGEAGDRGIEATRGAAAHGGGAWADGGPGGVRARGGERAHRGAGGGVARHARVLPDEIQAAELPGCGEGLHGFRDRSQLAGNAGGGPLHQVERRRCGGGDVEDVLLDLVHGRSAGHDRVDAGVQSRLCTVRPASLRS